MTLPELSIVVPVYNEAENLDNLFNRLEAVLQKLNSSYEIVCVNDGSRDETLLGLIAHHRRNPAIKIVNFFSQLRQRKLP